MQNSKSIAQIMEELGLDPNDAAMKATIEQIIAAQPHVYLDERFVAKLRSELAELANTQSQPKQSTNFFAIFMKRTMISAVVVLLVIVAGGAWLLQRGITPRSQQDTVTELLSSKYAVKDVEANSFGTLNSQNLSAGSRSESGGGTGIGGDMANPSASSAQNTGNAPAPDTKMIAPGEPYPGAITYVFDYKGEALTGLADTEPVFKRIKPVQSPDLVSRIIGTLSLGLIDLNKFHDAQLETFNLIEDREMGYSVNVMLTQGTVSIYQNWYTWPQPYAACRDEACWRNNQIKIDQIPSDEEAINITDAFLNEYGISRDGYGAPLIQYDQWRIQYAQAADKTSIYLPEQVNVTYPLLLEGKTVFDEGGNYYGLNVTVDARTRKVASAYEMTTRQFEKSNYAAETDTKRILGVAERGGFRNYIYDDPNAKKITLELGTPTREMVNMWYSQDQYKGGEPIYVPALVFPITNFESSNYWRKNVIVPLVKEILDSDTNQGGPITIMEGSAGSTEASPPKDITPTPAPPQKEESSIAQ